MTIRLLVARSTGESGPDEYFFDLDCITIGRGGNNTLILPDQQRVVSSNHAEVRRQNGTTQLVDLGSKNFTFLNGRKMLPNVPYELHSGDSFRIGEFDITLEHVAHARQDYDRTIFDASFINVFEEDADQLASALRNIRLKFDAESPSRRVDALRDALEQAGLRLEPGEADDMVAGALGVSPERAAFVPPPAPYPPPAPAPYPPPPVPYASPALARGNDAFAPVPTRTPAAYGQADFPARGPAAPLDTGLDRLLNTVLRAFSKIVSSPWQFRHEFIGQTMMHTADHAAISSGDPEAVKAHLLDPTAGPDEIERRFAFLESLASDVVLHQLGLLDGYKASVQEGTRTLLEELNPDALENTIGQQNAMLRMNATLRKSRAFDMLKEKQAEVQGENWSVAERRIFRPAFIRSYLSRITNSRR